MQSPHRFFSFVILLVASTLAQADSLLVGTNLAAASHGNVVLCPGSECQSVEQQFTLLTPVVIDDIKISITGPIDFFPNPNGNFSVGFGNQLGAVTSIGASALPFSSNQSSPITEVFDLNNLNISLAAGTYYLQIAGANVAMDEAPPVMTPIGSLGSFFFCDPLEPGCNVPNGWKANLGGPLAVDISGTVVTPEPSTFALLGTGMLGMMGALRRKFYSHR